MKLIPLSLFFLCAILHLIALIGGWERFRRITKAGLMPFLLGYYLLGARTPLVAVAAALIFGWVGDIILISAKDNRRFTLGVGSFLLGHLCYIRSLMGFIDTINMRALIIIGAAGICMALGVVRVIKPPRNMLIPVALYAGILMGLGIMALVLVMNRGDALAVMMFAGSLCFMASDTTLGYFTFRTLPRYGNLAVMITYIAAQFCLIQGFVQLV
jgi:uncharacterized membrane protein YhhN